MKAQDQNLYVMENTKDNFASMIKTTPKGPTSLYSSSIMMYLLMQAR